MTRSTLLPVSVYIITLNEAHTIGRLLDQLSVFQEIIVVDSGSTDSTQKIAASYSNVRVLFKEWSGYSAQKAYALAQCRCDWVLNLDADEELTPRFVEELKVTIAEGCWDALESCRIDYHWGKRPRNFAIDRRLIRLFRRKVGHYEPRRVHERITVSGRIRKTSAFLIHHQNMTIEEVVKKYNKYSQLRAMDKFELGHRSNLPVLLFIFPWVFVQHYFFKGFMLDGSAGFIGSINLAYYHFMKYAKLWELQHNKSVKQQTYAARCDSQPQGQ